MSNASTFKWYHVVALWFALEAILLLVWGCVEPATLVRFFDNDGHSPFELATLPFYFAIVPLVWWKCPFAGSKTRRLVLCTMVSVVALMAIVKELDLHLVALHALYPDFVSEGGGMCPGLFKPDGRPLSGTPFKMRVLTNAGVPFGMKAFILAYFVAFFGTFVAGFAYLFRTWFTGVLKLDPVAWAYGCFGASGVLVQVSDRIPAWVGHSHGLGHKSGAVTHATSFCTCLEEGDELLIAIFALLTIYLGWRALQACHAQTAQRSSMMKHISLFSFSVFLFSFAFAAAPFPSDYTLNGGRAIAFPQALPRQRNAATGKACDWYNIKHLAIPGVATGSDPSLAAFLHLLRNVIVDERACLFADGRAMMVNKNWIRDHVHVLKALRHWEYDYQGFVDFILDHQRADGMFYELLKPWDDGHWQFTSPKSVKFFPDDDLYLARLEIEADIEYLLVEGATYCYRISGDDAWLARVLPRLEKAIDFQTHDPMYWDAAHGLVKRGYTIDTWDFLYIADSGRRRALEPDTPRAIMHGDNSGVYQAMQQLAWFNERLGRAARAAAWRARAEAIRANMYKYLWNGDFFIHELPLNVPPRDEHERERLSLSAAYDMNRGLMSGDDCRRTIDAFRARRATAGAFAEWFTVDPPYAAPFGRHPSGDYVNGAICLFTAGELAKAALENGREAYGWDILRRVKALAERDGALYFLYDRKTAKSINPEAGPSSWGAASVLSAIDESLAGIRDEGVRYDAIRFAPRWPVTGLTEVFYVTGYEAAKSVVTVQYVCTAKGMRYRLKSPARSLTAHILLPSGQTAREVLLNGRPQSFTTVKVADSQYVDFVCTGAPVCEIEILFAN